LPIFARRGKLGPAKEAGRLSAEQNRAPPGSGEFVARVALMISLVALSIDAMLPALPAIGADLGVHRANDAQLVLSALFFGLALAQMVYGPLSDSFGRKPVIYAGFAIFIAGCVLSILARGLEVMLLGRFLQGIGAAGPRIVTMALVRDQYAGRAMARIMSLAMAVFILVPVLAPAIGQVILLVAHWRAIFGMLLVVALITLAWFALRQPETLPPARRAPFALRSIAAAVRETCSHRSAFSYTLMAGLIFGAFVGRSRTSSSDQNRPRPRMSPIWSCPPKRSRSRASSSAPIARTLARRASSSMADSTASAPAQAAACDM
jgi:DHA1 family bicyclomycin/chloramphenicol resistance-like MFS transporter